MPTHVCLESTEDLYNGWGLTKDIHDWLTKSVGSRANDMTELLWTSKQWYFKFSYDRMDPRYAGSRPVAMSTWNQPGFLHFLFYQSSHATMFKLAWGGQC